MNVKIDEDIRYYFDVDDWARNFRLIFSRHFFNDDNHLKNGTVMERNKADRIKSTIWKGKTTWKGKVVDDEIEFDFTEVYSEHSSFIGQILSVDVSHVKYPKVKVIYT